MDELAEMIVSAFLSDWQKIAAKDPESPALSLIWKYGKRATFSSMLALAAIYGPQLLPFDLAGSLAEYRTTLIIAAVLVITGSGSKALDGIQALASKISSGGN